MMRVSGSGALPNFGVAITAPSSGRMSLPVSRGNYIYSQFRNVSGVPAPEGARGVSISKLKVLDVLIEQLREIKKQPGVDFNGITPPDDRVDALISQYEGQIKTARAASAAMPYIPAPTAPTGVLFSLSA